MDIRAEYSRWLERAVDDSDLIEELRGLDPTAARSPTAFTATWPSAPAAARRPRRGTTG